MCEEPNFNFGDLNLDFLDFCTPPRLKKVEHCVTPIPKQAFPSSKCQEKRVKKQKLAERIANTDVLVQQVHQLKQQLQDFQQSADTIQKLYKSEKLLHEEISDQNIQLRNKCEHLDAELADGTLKNEQLKAKLDDNTGPISFNELALQYLKLARKRTDENGVLHWTEQSLQKNLQKHCEAKNLKIPPPQSPKKRVRKIEKAVQCTLWSDQPKATPPPVIAKPETRDQGMQCTVATHTQGSQHISTTTTRSTSTSCFIKQHHVGTSFPETAPMPPLEDILKELMQWDGISPVSPILDQEEAPKPTTTTKTIGTCTFLCNIHRQIDFLPPLCSDRVIKRSDSRPPSRFMCDSLKDEPASLSPPLPNADINENQQSGNLHSIPILNSFMTAQTLSNLQPSAFEALWQMFGQMLLGLLHHRSTVVPLSLTEDALSQQEFQNWMRSLYDNMQQQQQQEQNTTGTLFNVTESVPNVISTQQLHQAFYATNGDISPLPSGNEQFSYSCTDSINLKKKISSKHVTDPAATSTSLPIYENNKTHLPKVNTKADITPCIRLPPQNEANESLSFAAKQYCESKTKQQSVDTFCSPDFLNEISKILPNTEDITENAKIRKSSDACQQKQKKIKKSKKIKHKHIKSKQKQISKIKEPILDVGDTAVEFIAKLSSFRATTDTNYMLQNGINEMETNMCEGLDDMEYFLNKSASHQQDENYLSASERMASLQDNSNAKEDEKNCAEYQQNADDKNICFRDIATSLFGSDTDMESEESLNIKQTTKTSTENSNHFCAVNELNFSKNAADIKQQNGECAEKIMDEEINKGLDYIEKFLNISSDERSSVNGDTTSNKQRKAKKNSKCMREIVHSVFGSDTDMESDEEAVIKKQQKSFAKPNEKMIDTSDINSQNANLFSKPSILESNLTSIKDWNDETESILVDCDTFSESTTGTHSDTDLVIDEDYTVAAKVTNIESDSTVNMKSASDVRRTLNAKRDKLVNGIENTEEEFNCTDIFGSTENNTINSTRIDLAMLDELFTDRTSEIVDQLLRESVELSTSTEEDSISATGEIIESKTTQTTKELKKRGRKRKIETTSNSTATPVVPSIAFTCKRSIRLRDKQKILNSDKCTQQSNVKNIVEIVALMNEQPASMFQSSNGIDISNIKNGSDFNFKENNLIAEGERINQNCDMIAEIPQPKKQLNYEQPLTLSAYVSKQLQSVQKSAECINTQFADNVKQHRHDDHLIVPQRQSSENSERLHNNQQHMLSTTNIDSYDSPASPPPIDKVDLNSDPKLIPLELSIQNCAVNRNDALLQQLVTSYSFEQYKIVNAIHSKRQLKYRDNLKSQLHAQIKCAFENPNPSADNLVLNMLKITNDYDIILTAIVQIIREVPRPEIELACSVDKVPEKYLSASHQLIACVLRHLQHMRPTCISELIAQIERILFNYYDINRLKLTTILNLTQLYLIAIGYQSETNGARLFLAKCLYYYKERATPMIYEVLCCYPTTLPYKENRLYDRSDALITVLQHILMVTKYDMNNPELRGKELLSKLRFIYHYEPFKPIRDEVLLNLYEKLKAGKLTHISYAYAIVCKRINPQQVEVDVIQKTLLPLANEYYALLLHSDLYIERVVAILDCISMVLKPFPLETDVNAYLALFARFLNVGDNQNLVKEAALHAILRLQRFGYANCFNTLSNFKPTFVLSARTLAMLRTFVHRKPKVFWQRLFAQSRDS